MAAIPIMRALLNLQRSVAVRCSSSLLMVQLASSSRVTLCTVSSKNEEPKFGAGTENVSLLENLNLMGVDVKMARQRQPGVFRKVFTNEQGLAVFLKRKGANRKVIAGIISRFPRAITRSVDHLERRWELWRTIFKSDAEIVGIIDRSPESFFRSSDNENLENNILYLTSLGFNSKDLYRLLNTAPRTFSNSVELNRQMVEFLEDTCEELGGEEPEKFAKAVISRNLYILIRSIKRVKTNIDYMKTTLKLSDPELLLLLQGPGAEILDLSNVYLKRNFQSLQEKMVSLGCHETDLKQLVFTYPLVLYIGPDTLLTKLGCLLKGGITMKQILEKPKVLEYSTHNITMRIGELQSVGYDFERNGITILDTSRKRFDARMEKLALSLDE